MDTAMTRISLALAATLLAGTTFTQGAGPAFAQATPGNTAPGATSNAPMPGAGSGTGATPGMAVMDRSTGWTSFDPAAPAYTTDQVVTERRRRVRVS